MRLRETVRMIRENPADFAVALCSVAAFFAAPWLMAVAWSASRGLL